MTEAPPDADLRARAARILLGEADDMIRRMEAELVGIDLERPYVTFRARPHHGVLLDEVAADLELNDCLARVMPVAEQDGDLIGLLTGRPGTVTSARVGLGPAEPVDRLVSSFRLASRAVDVASEFDLDGVHEFADLGLLPVIAADTDLGDALRVRFVDPVHGRDDGPGLIDVVGTWFAEGMHVEAVASRLSLHVNTVRNRLSRFERLCGTDLRDAGQALQVWWALQYAAREPGRRR